MIRRWFWLQLLLIFFFSNSAFSQDFSPKEVVKTFDFILENNVHESDYISMARSKAIEGIVESEVKSISKLEIEDKNMDGRVNSRLDFINISEIQAFGIWVKDITPPEITYTKRGAEKWITIKVHGYAAKKPNKTEARELLLKQLSTKSLEVGVQVHSIEYYRNDFVISIVVLDSTNYKSISEMNKVASSLAKIQVLNYFQGSKIEDVFIYKTSVDGKFVVAKDKDSQNTYSAVKESSSGWVNAIELLNKIKIKGTNDLAFVFIKEIED
jgi:hypothetical protein